MSETNNQPTGLDRSSKPAPDRPVVARMYDWYLGGTHSYEIDRLAAAEVAASFPEIKSTAIENRMFGRRAVRWLAQNGITQFIDIGSGLPTANSTHETVLKVEPEAKVLYVDIEESAVEEGRQYIGETGCEKGVGMIQADAHQPAAIVAHAETRRLIDFGKPVAILMFAVLHFWSDEHCVPVLNYWKATLAKGSAFALTHGTGDGRDAEELEGMMEVYKRTSMQVVLRSRDEVSKIMEGWDLVKPGIVRPHLWETAKEKDDREEWPMTRMMWAGVGFLG